MWDHRGGALLLEQDICQKQAKGEEFILAHKGHGHRGGQGMVTETVWLLVARLRVGGTEGRADTGNWLILSVCCRLGSSP